MYPGVGRWPHTLIYNSTYYLAWCLVTLRLYGVVQNVFPLIVLRLEKSEDVLLAQVVFHHLQAYIEYVQVPVPRGVHKKRFPIVVGGRYLLSEPAFA